MITFKHKGDFSKFNSYIERIKEVVKLGDLDRFGRRGVEALKEATPVDTGKTANSWVYRIVRQNGSISIEFDNTNINQGAKIAILLQYGHRNHNGGYVQGRDYINPAIQPIFDEIAEEAWKEVTKQ